MRVGEADLSGLAGGAGKTPGVGIFGNVGIPWVDPDPTGESLAAEGTEKGLREENRRGELQAIASKEGLCLPVLGAFTRHHHRGLTELATASGSDGEAQEPGKESQPEGDSGCLGVRPIFQNDGSEKEENGGGQANCRKTQKNTALDE